LSPKKLFEFLGVDTFEMIYLVYGKQKRDKIKLLSRENGYIKEKVSLDGDGKFIIKNKATGKQKERD